MRSDFHTQHLTISPVTVELGVAVLKAVHGINEDTVAIMITGYASLDSSIEAMNEGAYSYLTKLQTPF